MEKRAGRGPLTFDGSRGNFKDLGGLLDGEAAEKTQFDDAALQEVEPGEVA